MLTSFLGIAVVPTWFALREHVPVEIPENYDGERSEDDDLYKIDVFSKDERNPKLGLGEIITLK